MKKQNVRTLSLIVGTFTYLLVGAAVFDHLESTTAGYKASELKKMEEQWVEQHGVSQQDYRIMEVIVLGGVPHKAGKQWKFAGALYYATTVLTTIGYGHSTPNTIYGKTFTVLYAVFGIPLCLVLFHSIGERLNKVFSMIIRSIKRLFKFRSNDVTDVDLILAVTTSSTLTITAGAAVFSSYEQWSYFDSVYYCVITLTTIGFGDMVALQKNEALEKQPEYVAFSLVFILFGMAIVAACLNLFVLGLVTMNTEDERRDEAEALQAAAGAVRLEGDVITANGSILSIGDPEARSIGCFSFSGLVGRSWAMLFAASGYEVSIYDAVQKQVTFALGETERQLQTLEKSGMLRGSDSAQVQFSRIKGVSSLKECIQGAFYVQECVPEELQLKQEVFTDLDAIAGDDTILASSTSTMIPSTFTSGLQHRANCVVAHPVNPPYFVPLVEIVPAPWTSPCVVEKTKNLLKEIGQEPVVLKKEHAGFGLNRLQYTILNECYHLVNDGVMSADDVDKLVKFGLGPRYAWMGPLETALLNAEGMRSYLERYTSGIHAVSGTLKGPADWSLPAAEPLLKELDELFPLDKLEARRQRRDERLIALAALRAQMNKKETDE
ncbi:3-hydroxyacyl-CoA dehydrogenase NAD binding [Trinorchestia longiramus]|nr:3-hydroxyacyl-CoA dehydrogenase NAD binding [Trinorchestia longiramus]